MMRYIFTLLLISLSFGNKAQHLVPVQHDTLVHNFEVFSHGIADYSATSIERGFVNKFLYGGEITEQLKDQSFDRHGSVNRLGFDIQAEAEFRNYRTGKFPDSKFGWLIRGGMYNYGSMIYSQDLFGLAFYGNERYLGETVEFSGSRGSVWSMQKLGFGFINKKTKSNISLNLYSIGAYSQFQVANGSMYQTADADSLFIAYRGGAEFLTADGLNRGWGIGVDADYRMPIDLTETKRIYIQFIIKNVGLSYLPNMTSYVADSSFAFKGFTFDQIFGDAQLVGDNFSVMDTLNFSKREYAAVRFLPSFLQVGKMIDEHNASKIQAFYGIRLYPSVVLIPHAYAGVHWNATNWYSTGINMSYGGYGLLKFGWYSSFKVKNWNIGVATENIYGTFSKKGLGESIVGRIQWRI